MTHREMQVTINLTLEQTKELYENILHDNMQSDELQTITEIIQDAIQKAEILKKTGGMIPKPMYIFI